MRRTVFCILVIFLIAGLAYGKTYEVRKKVGAYEAEIRLEKNPPILGDNDIEIQIRDNGGKLVTDAKILINYYMPPMPRMAPMNYKTDATLKKEKYKATMNLIMSGPWIIAVKITREGKTSTAKINVDAQ